MPLGAAQMADWSAPALALASIAQAFFEPDPDITWDGARAAALLRALEPAAAPETSQPPDVLVEAAG
jgi:hypothetical protein